MRLPADYTEVSNMSDLRNNLEAEYSNTLDAAYRLLDDNTEWKERYAGYITKITTSDFPLQCKFVRKITQINWPLAAYLNISKVTTGGLNFDLRLFGTSIATVLVRVNDLTKDEYKLIKDDRIDLLDRKRMNSLVRVSFEKKDRAFEKLVKDDKAIVKRDFICSDYWDEIFIQKMVEGSFDDHDGSQEYGWHDKYVEKFRSMIRSIYDAGGFSVADEHAHESNMLHLMSINSKYFNAIQPVRLEDCFFQMPTPFKGSQAKKGSISYAGNNGGGIDILARKKYGAKSELCVIEIKDKYESGEEPIKAIKQAISYSGFLMKLIKSKSGMDWYKYFGVNSSRDNCNINAVIAMPFKTDKSGMSAEDTAFDGMVLDAGDGCTITLSYLYYDPHIFASDDYDDDNVAISIKRDRVRADSK